MRLNLPTVVSLILVIVGAINWGLIGLLGFDLVAALFGEMSVVSRIVYTLVGIAGVVVAIAFVTARKHERHVPEHSATR